MGGEYDCTLAYVSTSAVQGKCQERSTILEFRFNFLMSVTNLAYVPNIILILILLSHLSEKNPASGKPMNWPTLLTVPTNVSFHLFSSHVIFH